PQGNLDHRRKEGRVRLRGRHAQSANRRSQLRPECDGLETVTEASPSRPAGRTAGFVTRTTTRSAPKRVESSSATAPASASTKLNVGAAETSRRARATAL